MLAYLSDPAALLRDVLYVVEFEFRRVCLKWRGKKFDIVAPSFYGTVDVCVSRKHFGQSHRAFRVRGPAGSRAQFTVSGINTRPTVEASQRVRTSSRG